MVVVICASLAIGAHLFMLIEYLYLFLCETLM